MHAQSLGRVWLFATTLNCSPSDSSVHGIFQEILDFSEYYNVLPFSSPGESSLPRDWSWVFCVTCFGRQVFTTAPPGKPMQYGEWTLKNKLQLRKLLFKKNVHLVSSNLLQPPKQWRRPESWFWRAENCSCKSHKNLDSNPAWPFSTSIPLVSYWVVLRPGFPVCKSGKIRLTFQCCHEASKW